VNPHDGGRCGYRLEWRRPEHVAENPSFGLWSTFDDGDALKVAAAALVTAGTVHQDEFHVALIYANGAALVRVPTTAGAIRDWDGRNGSLPAAVDGGSWAAAVAREEAGLTVLDAVRTAAARAHAAGALDDDGAVELMRAVRETLDTDED